MKKITILLVDDHPVVRQGLSALLQMENDLEVVAEAANGRTAVALTKEIRPDVVVMDLSMPLLNGIEATRQILQAEPSAKVLVLSSYGDDEFVERMMQAGASGYLTKDTAATELAQGIRAVHAGKTSFSPAIARHVREAPAAAPAADGPAPQPVSDLTSRQMEVLQLLAEGMPNKQIADELGLSIKTIEKHRQQLMEKVGVHDIAGLTRFAVVHGVVECKTKCW